MANGVLLKKILLLLREPFLLMLPKQMGLLLLPTGLLPLRSRSSLLLYPLGALRGEVVELRRQIIHNKLIVMEVEVSSAVAEVQVEVVG